jgi:hypothetical protein
LAQAKGAGAGQCLLPDYEAGLQPRLGRIHCLVRPGAETRLHQSDRGRLAGGARGPRPLLRINQRADHRGVTIQGIASIVWLVRSFLPFCVFCHTGSRDAWGAEQYGYGGDTGVIPIYSDQDNRLLRFASEERPSCPSAGNEPRSGARGDCAPAGNDARARQAGLISWHGLRTASPERQDLGTARDDGSKMTVYPIAGSRRRGAGERTVAAARLSVGSDKLHLSLLRTSGPLIDTGRQRITIVGPHQHAPRPIAATNIRTRTASTLVPRPSQNLWHSGDEISSSHSS